MPRFIYHSRHIPEEHLRLEKPSGKRVKENMLCDAMEEENARILHESGVTVIETRLVWWELEKEKGKLDWSCFDKRVEDVEKAGFEVGLLPWFMHPPAWENEMVRSKCLEHGEESTIISLWEPKLLELYDRLYDEVAKRYGDRIKYIYFSFHGDFGEPQYPDSTCHYQFSPPHGHQGFWCGDKLAREDYKKYLQKKYATIDDVNKAWGTSFSDWDDDLMPRMPFIKNSLALRMDFRMWYTKSMEDFSDKVGAIIRKHFPTTRGGVPIGSLREPLAVGQVKSQEVKRLAKYNTLIRWTGLLNIYDFGVMNLSTLRIGSATRYYSQSEFGTEAALLLNGDMAYNVLYTNICNGSSVLHNDLTNITRGWDDYQEWKDKMPVLPVHCSIAVFYPIEGEQLECMLPENVNFDIEKKKKSVSGASAVSDEVFTRGEWLLTISDEFYQETANLRKKFNYELADSYMIEDGFLDTVKDLVIASTCPIPESTAKIMLNWVKNGGRVWFTKDTTPWILETSEMITDYLKRNNEELKTVPGSNYGFYSVSEIPEFEPYASIKKKYAKADEELYSTLHGRCYSVYMPEKKKILFDEISNIIK